MKTLVWFAMVSTAMSALWAQTVETIPFRAVLSPRNEVPAITNLEASGNGTFLLHVVRDANGRVTSASAEYRVSYQFPAAINFVGMHIHRGNAGENGPVVINSPVTMDNSPGSETGRGSINVQFQIGPNDTNALEAVNGVLSNPAGYYLNLHTPANPGGAIRGQLERAEMVVLIGMMNPRNEVPAIPDLNASGVTTITALRTVNSSGAVTSGIVTFDHFNIGFPEGTLFTGFHIHSGAAGVNGPVTVDTALNRNQNIMANPGGGTLRYEVELNPATAAQVSTLNGLFSNPQGYYVNLHTAVNPGGAIRAQLRRTDRMNFQMTLSPANEVPPITDLNASAPSAVTIHTVRDDQGVVTAGHAVFDVNARFPSSTTFTGLHIHTGAAGTNGGVVIDTGLGSGDRSVMTPTGNINIYRTANVTSAAGLTALNNIITNPENYYVNLHTTVNPGGAVRNQLAAPNANRAVISSAGSAIQDPARRTVAPGGLLTLTGTNLTRVPGDPSASIPGATLPNRYNGTSVNIGAGRPAPVVVANGDILVVQVPNETPAGEAEVIVRTPAGETTGTRVTVAALAPAIFFGQSGGIFLKNSDYSLVSTTNPARAGDVLLVYSTGLGAIPALPTGQLPPQPNASLSNLVPTAPVRVSIGGRDATVIYSLASPGYVGLYQTAFTVPAGLTAGSQPVTLSVGNATSNQVTVPVQ
jgi:uncharacterized protein (TIGR03437 family)